MIGFPSDLNTKQDYENALDYVKEHPSYRKEMKRRLENLRDNIYMNVLKAGAEKKDPEKLTPEDFESVINPACDKNRLGFTDKEINQMLKECGDA